MRVNLNKKKKTGSNINLIQLIIVLLIIVILALGLFHYYSTYRDYINYKNKLKHMNNKISNLQKKQIEFNQLQKKMDQLSKQEIPQNNYNWDQILVNLGKETPEKVMIDNLRINKTDITIEGIAANGQNINTFLEGLKTSPLLIDIRLDQLIKNNNLNFVIKGQITVKEKGVE